jgi:aryl-alcohol dehydrogenase-like predicted oxidoreductase
MKYTKLGNTGVTVSRLCFGCMTYGGGPQPKWAMPRDRALNEQEAREHFAIAVEAGITFFDTADTYSAGGSEEITGKWLKEMASDDCGRDEVWGLRDLDRIVVASTANTSSKPATPCAASR